MANRPISELDPAVYNSQTGLYFGNDDLFAISQDGYARKLSGGRMIEALLTLAQSHGGISSITGPVSVGLVDTYTINYVDGDTDTFDVTNGNGITSIGVQYAVSTSNTTVPSSWSSTMPEITAINKYLWTKLTISVDSGSPTVATFVAGAYGDKGDKGDTGDTGATGDPATLVSNSVSYQWSDDGDLSDVPTGTWSDTVPARPYDPQTGTYTASYLWTRTIVQFNTGSAITSYSIGYFGTDGTGAVNKVNNISPAANGNVTVDAANIMVDSNSTVQSRIEDAESDITDLATAAGDIADLSGFTASTLVGAANELKTDVTNKILYFNNQAVSASATTGQIMRIPASGTNSAITTDTVVLECVFSNPSSITSDVSWQSYSGYITFTGTSRAATTANVTLGTKGN